ncbi:MAG: LptF/LptG family permease [Bacteroidota bacterium]
MKKIDRLVVTSFVAPFIATFFIALFVLIMQFLWTYIDDILGKGANLWILLELLSYLSMSLVPTALPVAVLISSVMVMGNMAENYELASLKSAGVPLLRVMFPLVLFTSGIAVFSFFCSNNIIPIANLKFKSRLYDIKRQKPTLNLEEGVFNDDFKNMVIHIGEKAEDNRTIYDVIIYDHNPYNNKKVSVITAKKGEMYTSKDQRYFIMNLYDGIQYQETKANNTRKEKSYPFVRTSFEKWNKVFDLSEFDMKETNTELFKSHQTMLSTAQLKVAIDSLDRVMYEKRSNLAVRVNRSFRLLKDSITFEQAEKERTKGMPESVKTKIDSIRWSAKPHLKPVEKIPAPKPTAASKKKVTAKKTNIKKKPKNKKPARNYNRGYKQAIDQPLEDYDRFLELFPQKEHHKLIPKARSLIRSIKNESETSHHVIERKKESRVKHVYELNFKYSMALVCIIFLFIGAPMGAIIRKGGFGYPLLISILFFMLFIVMNIFCKKVAESHTLPAVLASWLPCMILFPIGAVLTFRAMNDSKVINTERYARLLRFFIRFLSG